MQKAVSEFRTLPEAEVLELVGSGPLLVTHNGEPHMVAQSLESFEAMVRRLRLFESATQAKPAEGISNVIPFKLKDRSKR